MSINSFDISIHSDENAVMEQLFEDLVKYEAEFFGEYPTEETLNEMEQAFHR